MSSEGTGLVERARGGDHAAFEALYRRHVRAVASTVASRLSTPEDRADAVQETFIKAWNSLDTLRDDEQFLPWLYAIARNAATSIGRRAGRTMADALDAESEPVAPDVGPEQLAELAMLVRAARDAMIVLSHRDATVLTMATSFGLGPKEIAVALDITEVNAAVVLHRARARLRRELVARGALGDDHG